MGKSRGMYPLQKPGSLSTQHSRGSAPPTPSPADMTSPEMQRFNQWSRCTAYRCERAVLLSASLVDSMRIAKQPQVVPWWKPVIAACHFQTRSKARQSQGDKMISRFCWKCFFPLSPSLFLSKISSSLLSLFLHIFHVFNRHREGICHTSRHVPHDKHTPHTLKP